MCDSPIHERIFGVTIELLSGEIYHPENATLTPFGVETWGDGGGVFTLYPWIRVRHVQYK